VTAAARRAPFLAAARGTLTLCQERKARAAHANCELEYEGRREAADNVEHREASQGRVGVCRPRRQTEPDRGYTVPGGHLRADGKFHALGEKLETPGPS
jgi:hypothetical protein